jgi:ferritin-like metal-binding protein YciE
MASESLQELLIDNLKDLIDAEKQITRALPKMARKATSEELRAGLEQHLRQTEGQIERLDRVFELLGEPARGKKCPGMQGLIEEGNEHLEEVEQGSGMDAVLIASAQKVEHYEMAAYGTARTWANQLGLREVAQLLEQTLDEEKQTDRQLTQLAESLVNPQAAQSASEEEDGKAGSAARGRSAAARAIAAERRSSRGGQSRSGESRSSGRSRTSGSSGSVRSSSGGRSRKRSR